MIASLEGRSQEQRIFAGTTKPARDWTELASRIKATVDVEALKEIAEQSFLKNDNRLRLVLFSQVSKLKMDEVARAEPQSLGRLLLTTSKHASEAVLTSTLAMDGHFLANSIHSAGLMLELAAPFHGRSEAAAEAEAILCASITLWSTKFREALKRRQTSGLPFPPDLEGALELSRWSTSSSRTLGALSIMSTSSRAAAPVERGEVQRLVMASLDSCAAALQRCQAIETKVERKREAIRTSGGNKTSFQKVAEEDEEGQEMLERTTEIRAQCFSDLTLVVTSMNQMLRSSSAGGAGGADVLNLVLPPTTPPTSSSSTSSSVKEQQRQQMQLTARLLKQMLSEILSTGLMPSLPGASIEALTKAASAVVEMDGRIRAFEASSGGKTASVKDTKQEKEDEALDEQYQESLAVLLSGIANEATVRLQSATKAATTAVRLSDGALPSRPSSIRLEVLVSLLDLYSSSLGAGRTRRKRHGVSIGAEAKESDGKLSVRAPHLFSAAADYLLLPADAAAVTPPADPSVAATTTYHLSTLSSPYLARVARSYSSSRFVEWENPIIASLWSAIAITTAKRLTDSVKLIKTNSALLSSSSLPSSPSSAIMPPAVATHILASFARASVKAPALVSLALLHLDALLAACASSAKALSAGDKSTGSDGEVELPQFPLDARQAISLLWCCALQGIYQPQRVVESILEVAIEGLTEEASSGRSDKTLEAGALGQLYLALTGLAAEGPGKVLTAAPSSLLFDQLSLAYRQQEQKQLAATTTQSSKQKQVKSELIAVLRNAVDKAVRLQQEERARRAKKQQEETRAARGRRGRRATRNYQPSATDSATMPADGPHDLSEPDAAWRLLGDGITPVQISLGELGEVGAPLSLDVDFALLPSSSEQREGSDDSSATPVTKGVVVLILGTSHFVRTRLLPLGPATGPVRTDAPLTAVPAIGGGSTGSGRLAALPSTVTSLPAVARSALLASASLPGGLAFPGMDLTVTTDGTVKPPSPATSVSLGLRRALLADEAAASMVDEEDAATHMRPPLPTDGDDDTGDSGPPAIYRSASAASLSLLETFSSALPTMNLSTQAKVRWLERKGYKVVTIASHLEWPTSTSVTANAGKITSLDEKTEWLLEEKGLRKALLGEEQ
jgi:hypothetical protein